MIENKMSFKRVILIVAVTLVLFCFYRINYITDLRHSAVFNECRDVTISSTEFVEYSSVQGRRAAVTCRYVVRNDSGEDKTIRFMGMYTDIKDAVVQSDRLYVVPAGSTEEIVVTYISSCKVEYPIDHAPEAHILEA